MSLYIVKADITDRNVDAIVCTANTGLKLVGLIGDKILQKAGKTILTELKQIGHCDVGNAVITRGYNLKAKNVIHVVGPVYIDGKHGEAKLLKQAYLSALNLAMEYSLDTIEFPLISSGANGFPNKEAVKIAISTIQHFIALEEINVGLVIYSDETFDECKKYFQPFQCHIGKGYVKQVDKEEYAHERLLIPSLYPGVYDDIKVEAGIVQSIKSTSSKPLAAPEENFNSKLWYYLHKCGMNQVMVYKKAGIDRRLFSKIISNKDYVPKKITIINLIIGMELSIKDAEDLLNSAGYTFSKSILFDFIIKSFIEEGNYDANEINDVLEKNNLPLIC